LKDKNKYEECISTLKVALDEIELNKDPIDKKTKDKNEYNMTIK
jgi:hypothetical protein